MYETRCGNVNLTSRTHWSNTSSRYNDTVVPLCVRTPLFAAEFSINAVVPTVPITFLAVLTSLFYPLYPQPFSLQWLQLLLRYSQLTTITAVKLVELLQHHSRYSDTVTMRAPLLAAEAWIDTVTFSLQWLLLVIRWYPLFSLNSL